MECSSCRSSLPDDARFCPRCGAPASPAQSTEAIADPLRATLATALGRQYEIVRVLGHGGMGAVYLATETALERDVAIKVLPPDRAATKESRDRFRREARTAARLSHPRIVPLHTFGDVDGTLFFVMGYVRGESLAARLRREGRLPLETARRILVEIADALDYAHGLGIVHRDIKPDNVLLEEGTGRAMLTDFGIAKALGAGQTVTADGSILGTPHYMSPEQAQGKSDVDARTDIYALGVMGYAMLAGRLPFEGTTPADVLVQHITREAPALTSLAPDLPPDLGAALTRCLAKDPDQRWPDARALKAALTGTEEDEPPIQLEGVSSLFKEVLICGAGLWYIGAWWLGGGDVESPLVLLPILLAVSAASIASLLAFRMRRLRRAGFAWPRILYAVFGQPRGWFGWYPRRLRASGDVWDRLPLDLRRARALLAWTVLALFVGLIPNLVTVIAFDWHHSKTGQSPYSRGVRDAVTDTVLAVFLLAASVYLLLLWRWERFARRKLADPELRGYVLVTWTGRRSFWRRPEIAALLVPMRDPEIYSSPPTAPAELARAIDEACQALPAPARAACAPASATGRLLFESIQQLDREVAQLADTVDAADIARFADKLSALGPASASEGEDRGQMREMFQKQLDFMRGLEARLEGVKARRVQRVELLRTLWLAVADLRAAANAQTATSGGRLGDLIREIEQRARGPEGTTHRAGQPSIADMPTVER